MWGCIKLTPEEILLALGMSTCWRYRAERKYHTKWYLDLHSDINHYIQSVTYHY